MISTKIRIYALARDLNLDNDRLLRICRGLGFDVKNQLSSLNVEQVQRLHALIGRNRGEDGEEGPAVPCRIDPNRPSPGEIRAQAEPEISKQLSGSLSSRAALYYHRISPRTWKSLR